MEHTEPQNSKKDFWDMHKYLREQSTIRLTGGK